MCARPTDTGLPPIHHPWASATYEWLANLGSMQRLMNPLREEVVGQMYGQVLEIGAGSGRNFPYYLPERVAQVEAVEPDAAMLRYAQEHLSQARVPIHLVQAPVEALPFNEATFNSAVATLVFCSVLDPSRGMRELLRVLKSGADLFLVEHVRAQGNMAAHFQDLLVPLTTRLAGNCHWNRATEQTLIESGFKLVSSRQQRGGLQPLLIVHAMRP